MLLFHGTKPTRAPDVRVMLTSTVPSLLPPVLPPHKGQFLPDGEEKGQPNSRREVLRPAGTPLWLQAACWTPGAFTSSDRCEIAQGKRCSHCLPPGKYAEVNYLNTPSSHASARLEEAGQSSSKQPLGQVCRDSRARQALSSIASPTAGSNTSAHPRGWPWESWSMAEWQCSSGSASAVTSHWCWAPLCWGLQEDGDRADVPPPTCALGGPGALGENGSKVQSQSGGKEWIKWFLRI